MQDKKEKSLEGLRGLASGIVFLAHFSAAFIPEAIFGGGKESRFSLFYQTPLGFVLAGNFAVCIFFIMSGYVLSIKHFAKNTENTQIQGDAFKRYIRLGIPLLAICFLSFLIGKYGFYFNADIVHLTGNLWFQPYFNQLESKTYSSFLQDITLTLFTKAEYYDPPARTITIELIGSYLTFGLLIVVRKLKFRAVVYGIIFLLLSGNLLQNFILGIGVADLTVTFKKLEMAAITNHKYRFFAILLVYCLFLFAILLAGFPYYLSKDIIIFSGSFYQGFLFLDNRDLFGGGITLISSFLFFITYKYTIFKSFLEKNFMQSLGKYSFMLYLTHFISLSSITSLIYLNTSNMRYLNRLFLTFSVYLLSTVIATLLIEKLADIPSVRLSNKLKSFYLRHLTPE